MIKLLAERKSHDENTDAIKITVGVGGYDDEIMEELECMLDEFFRLVYKESGKCALCHAIMAARDAIQDVSDEILHCPSYIGGKHGKL